MPREEVRYYCDICGAFWEKKEKATECEKTHRVPLSMGKPIYDKDDRKNRYPDSIMVEFGKDDRIRYYRK